jgi:hypothetical protein
MRINGFDIRAYTPLERRILVAIGLNCPHKMRVRELVPYVYDDPWEEPDFPEDVIRVVMARMRRQGGLPDWVRFSRNTIR